MIRTPLLASLLGAALAALLAPAAVARPLTQKDLVGLDRVSDAHVSPDGKGQPAKWADGTNPR